MKDIIINNTNNLIWVDLEMTGLNPDKDHILEMAIVITDYNLNIIANNFDVIIYQPVEHLMWMNDWVRDVHTKNGLLNLSANSNINVLPPKLPFPCQLPTPSSCLPSDAISCLKLSPTDSHGFH